MIKSANPQGKGLSTATALIQQVNALAVSPPKQITQVANELFTSLFVLHSQFKFRPVLEKPYWLYWNGREFRLSLVSPDEWQDDQFGLFVGRCVMHTDMTWSMELSDEAICDPTLMQLIEQRRNEFEEKLRACETLEDALPGYQNSLPYYQRAFTTALSRSLDISMQQAGIAGLDYRQARLLAHKAG